MIKKYVLPIFLILEIVFLCTYYVYTKNGLPTIRKFQKENSSLQESVKSLTLAIDEIKSEITDLESFPYFQEKIAREQLQLMLPEEKIFYIV